MLKNVRGQSSCESSSTGREESHCLWLVYIGLEGRMGAQGDVGEKSIALSLSLLSRRKRTSSLIAATTSHRLVYQEAQIYCVRGYPHGLCAMAHDWYMVLALHESLARRLNSIASWYCVYAWYYMPLRDKAATQRVLPSMRRSDFKASCPISI